MYATLRYADVLHTLLYTYRNIHFTCTHEYMYRVHLYVTEIIEDFLTVLIGFRCCRVHISLIKRICKREFMRCAAMGEINAGFIICYVVNLNTIPLFILQYLYVKRTQISKLEWIFFFFNASNIFSSS